MRGHTATDGKLVAGGSTDAGDDGVVWRVNADGRRDAIGGNDVVRGLGGDDVICGGAGRDRTRF